MGHCTTITMNLQWYKLSFLVHTLSWPTSRANITRICLSWRLTFHISLIISWMLDHVSSMFVVEGSYVLKWDKSLGGCEIFWSMNTNLKRISGLHFESIFWVGRRAAVPVLGRALQAWHDFHLGRVLTPPQYVLLWKCWVVLFNAAAELASG